VAGTKEYQEKLLPRLSSKGFMDGVILQSGHHADQAFILELKKTNLPLLVAGRPLYVEEVCFIDIDNVAAAEKAVRHLINNGRKRIATITGPLTSTVGLDRMNGYRNAIAATSQKLTDNLIQEADFTEIGGYNAMKILLEYLPDAIFAASDMMAIGAMRAIRDSELEVPKDIAVVGFDDLPIPAVNELQLTTIRQPVVQFGFKAVETLIELIENDSSIIKKVLMDTELIVRKSCGS
jgi:LacI family transcriptional regulator